MTEWKAHRRRIRPHRFTRNYQKTSVRPQKHKYELADEPKKQANWIFVKKKLALKLIVDYRATAAHKFRTRLVFNHYDVVLTKEQLMLTKWVNWEKKCKYNMVY